jgi:serine O-acetyltransferase
MISVVKYASKSVYHTTKHGRMWISSVQCAQIKQNVWNLLRLQAKDIVKREPLVYPLIEEGILKHNSFKEALIYRLATKLGGKLLKTSFWVEAMTEAMNISLESDTFEDIEKLAIEDLIAVEERDPACTSIAQAFLYFKGYKALQASRFSNVF